MRNIVMLLFLSYSFLFSATMKQEWSVQFDTQYFDQDIALVIDSHTNLYIGSRIDNNDLYVRKVTSSGMVVWEKRLDIQSFDSKNYLAVDANDNLLVAGEKRDDSNPNIHISQRPRQIVLAKFAPSGNLIWRKTYGVGRSMAKAVTIAHDGSILITGVSDQDMDGYTNNGDMDIFVIKFSADGQKRWSHLYGSSSYDAPSAITTDLQGNIFVTGETVGGIDGHTLQNEEWSDAFITKFSPDGKKIWTKEFGSAYGNSVQTDMNGNIYLCGTVSKLFDGKGSKGSHFIIKYNQQGNRLWTKQYGNPLNISYSSSLVIDDSGMIYVTGGLFGGIGEHPPINENSPDAHLLRFLPDGTLDEIMIFGTPSYDVAQSLVLDNEGNIFVAGWSTGDLDGNAHGGNHTVFLTKFQTEFQIYNLRSGWNLIGLNIVMSLQELQSQIGINNLLVVQGEESVYKKEYADSGLDFLNDFKGFVKKKGYWVKVSQESKIVYDAQ